MSELDTGGVQYDPTIDKIVPSDTGAEKDYGNNPELVYNQGYQQGQFTPSAAPPTSAGVTPYYNEYGELYNPSGSNYNPVAPLGALPDMRGGGSLYGFPLPPAATAPLAPSAPTPAAPVNGNNFGADWRIPYGGTPDTFVQAVLGGYRAPDPTQYPDLYREWVALHQGQAGYHNPNAWYVGEGGAHTPLGFSAAPGQTPHLNKFGQWEGLLTDDYGRPVHLPGGAFIPTPAAPSTLANMQGGGSPIGFPLPPGTGGNIRPAGGNAQPTQQQINDAMASPSVQGAIKQWESKNGKANQNVVNQILANYFKLKK